jgi:hypothetical protein
MANTLTNLIPTLVQGFDIVSREQVGFLPAVNRDPTTDRLAKNQTLYSWVTGAATLGDIAPAAATPTAGDKVLTTKSITVNNYKFSDFYFTGEEEKTLNVTGSYGNIVTDLVEQAIRAIVNQMESDIFTAAYVGSSRAYGTASTTPFATTVGDSAQIKKILDDNGAPLGNRSLIITTTAGAALRTLSNLTKVNEAGTTMTLRDGELLDLNKLSIKESAQITSPTVGTGTSYTSNTAGYAVGATSITLITGSGTILAGDVITFTGDTNKYVVATGVAAPGTIVLAAPGLKKALAASAVALSIVAASARNLAFSKNAILLATRLPARPSGGDLASDIQVITDPRSGISIEVSMYPQYRQVRYEVAAAWGVAVMKTEHIATLLGE